MKRFSLIKFIFPLLFLLGCSIPTHIYVQNLTDKDHIIVIKYKIPIEDLSHYRKVDFPYVDEIITPKKFIRLENEKLMEFKKNNDSSIVLNIPKQSTVRIETTSNTAYYRYIESFEWNGKSMKLEQLVSSSKRKGPHLVYQISEN